MLGARGQRGRGTLRSQKALKAGEVMPAGCLGAEGCGKPQWVRQGVE